LNLETSELQENIEKSNFVFVNIFNEAIFSDLRKKIINDIEKGFVVTEKLSQTTIR